MQNAPNFPGALLGDILRTVTRNLEKFDDEVGPTFSQMEER
jgi:hypothetical protein